MPDYSAPLADMRLNLREVADLAEIARLPGYEDADAEVVDAVLEEAGRLATEVLAPLNAVGDREGARFENGVVRAAPGFKEAYRTFVEGGWNALPFDPDYGGQGLPWTVAIAVQEMWNSANMAFALCPLLTQGAVELLQTHGSERQKDAYLPKLISGEWTGTMNLTEPQAGSDVGAAKTRATPEGEGFRLQGQKIFITWGEHDAAENIVHMVLARTPGAPEGSKGLSLFVVPKHLPDGAGAPGARNDLRCVSLEEKLGIHASPTCTMAYGDNEGAWGELVAEENRGLQAMFTMMNNARLSVGVQGLAIAERAYQAARAHAFERVQGRALGDRDGAPVPIVRHPDVRRMLMTMKAATEAMRALAYYTGGAIDRAKREPDAGARRRAQARVDLLTPVVKGWCTDLGVEMASLGVQVHGGMGYIEETGAAQYLRDARIAPIYEGTNGIQAMDLLTRKVVRDDGAAAFALVRELRAVPGMLEGMPGEDAPAIARALDGALDTLETATREVLEIAAEQPEAAAAGATPYLHLLGTVAGGALMGRAAAAAAREPAAEGPGGEASLQANLATTRFYVNNLLPRAEACAAQVRRGGLSTLALAEEQL